MKRKKPENKKVWISHNWMNDEMSRKEFLARIDTIQKCNREAVVETGAALENRVTLYARAKR